MSQKQAKKLRHRYHCRRALSAQLAMLDRFFYDVEQLLICDAPRGEMFEVINDLTDDQKENVLSLLNRPSANR